MLTVTVGKDRRGKERGREEGRVEVGRERERNLLSLCKMTLL
jgi:hypothetical protein